MATLPNTSDGKVHLAPSCHEGADPALSSSSQAQTWAQKIDFCIGNNANGISGNPGTNYGGFESNMRAANPNILLGLYFRGNSNNASSLPAFPDAWIAHNSSGVGSANWTQNTAAAQVILEPDVTSPAFNSANGWSDYHARNGIQVALTSKSPAQGGPYDIFYLDVMSRSNFDGSTNGTPKIPPTYTTAWTWANWRDTNLAGLIDHCKVVNPNALCVINCLSGAYGAKYASGEVTLGYMGHSDIVHSEQLLGTESASVTSYPSDANFRQAAGTVLDIQLAGTALVWRMGGTGTTAECAIRRYYGAAFTLLLERGALWVENGKLDLDYIVDQNQGVWTNNLGAPASGTGPTQSPATVAPITGSTPISVSGGTKTYARQFANGAVILCTDDTANRTVTLDHSDYVYGQGSPGTLSGTAVGGSTVTIQPNTALILTRSVVPPPPPVIPGVQITGTGAAFFNVVNDTVSGASIAPGGAAKTLGVTFSPPAGDTSTHTATLTITDNSGGVADSQQTVALSGTGLIVAGVATVAPNTLAFGPINVGVTASSTVRITNTGATNSILTINSVAITGDSTHSYSILSDTGETSLIFNQTRTLSIQYAPLASGTQTATLSVVDNSGGVANATQTCALSGTANAGVGTFSVSPASPFTFPNTAQGTANSQTFTVTNTGTGALDFSTVTLSTVGPPAGNVTVKSQVSKNTTVGNSLAMVNPPSTISGDFMLASVTSAGGSATTPPDTNWVKVKELSGGGIHKSLWRRFATSATDGQGTWTVTGATAVQINQYGFTNVDTTTPVRVALTTSGQSKYDLTLPAMTGIQANDEVCIFTGSASGPRPYPDPGTGCIFSLMPNSGGHYSTQSIIGQIEASTVLNRKIASGHSFAPWDMSTFPSSTTSGPLQDIANNRLPFISWPAETSIPGGDNGANPDTFLANIKNGTYDSILYNNAVALQGLEVPTVFRPFCELNGGDHPWEIGYSKWTAINGAPTGAQMAQWVTDFIAAWKRVWAITKGSDADITAFAPGYTQNSGHSAGAYNVTFLWNPQNYETTTTTRDKMYPGDPFVDFVGTEMYPTSTTQTAQSMFNDTSGAGGKTGHVAITNYGSSSGVSSSTTGWQTGDVGSAGGKLLMNGEGGPDYGISGDSNALCVTRIQGILTALKNTPNWVTYSYWHGSGTLGDNVLVSASGTPMPSAVITAVNAWVNDPYMLPQLHTTFSKPSGWTEVDQWRIGLGGNQVNLGANMAGHQMIHKTATGTSLAAPAVHSYGFGDYASIAVALVPAGGVVGNVAPNGGSVGISNIDPVYNPAATTTLTATPSGWSGTPAIVGGDYSYQWLRGSSSPVTIVQSVGDNDVTQENPSKSFPVSATTAGNAIFAVIACVTRTDTIASVVDSANNTGWVQLTGGGVGGTPGAGNVFIWWNPNPASSITSYTVNFTGATSKSAVAFFEVSGLQATADSGAGFTNNQTASTTASQSITTANANDFIISACSATAIPTTSSSPFSQSNASGGGASGLRLGVATASVGSTGTYTTSWSLASSVVNTTAIAAIKVQSSSVVGSAQTYNLQAADVTNRLTVNLTVNNGVAPNGTASATTNVVTTGGGGNPVNTTPPAVPASPQVNVAQVATAGTWTGALSFSRQWKKINPDNSVTTISGATSLTYTPLAADVGARLELTETAWAGAGHTGLSTSVTSSPSAAVTSGSSNQIYPFPGGVANPVFASLPTQTPDSSYPVFSGVAVAGNQSATEKNEAVYAIAQIGTLSFIGGAFTQACNRGGTLATRNRLVAVDDTNGHLVTDFIPNFNNTVRGLAISADGAYLYCVGLFTSVTLGSTTLSCNKMMRFNLSSVTANITIDTTWVPGTTASTVYTVALDPNGTSVWVGGDSLSQSPTATAPAFNGTTTHLGCIAVADGTNVSGINAVVISSSATSVDRTQIRKIKFCPGQTGLIFIGGHFDGVKSGAGSVVTMVGAAAINTADGTLNGWRPDIPTAAPAVDDTIGHDIACSPDGSFLVYAFAGSDTGNNFGNNFVRWEVSPTLRNAHTWADILDGDCNSVDTNGTYVWAGTHGDGTQNVNTIQNNGSQKICCVLASDGTGGTRTVVINNVNVVEKTSLWHSNPQFSSIQGTYVILCTNNHLKIGGVNSAPDQSLDIYTAS